MSDLARVKRLIKSLVPDFSIRNRKFDRFYTEDEARYMINDLAMDIPPRVLAGLLKSSVALDEFITGIYLVEQETRRLVVDDSGLLKAEYDPKVYVTPDRIAFSLRPKNEELIFAEFKLRRK